MRRRLLLTPVVALLSPAVALAQIATDGTTGPRVSLSGNLVEIGAGLGTQAGGNLFHSFDRFNVNQGQTVTFTGPGNVRNVVGRVTGGSPSAIDGTLRSTVGQADVHLINPAGMTFGPNAVVDVPASLHVGTAHEVHFADGARFSALDKSGSSFTAAPPAAFGFLDRPTGGLKVDGARISVKPGKALSLVGGDIEVRGGATGRVEAPGGSVTVASVARAGQVRLTDGTVNAAKRGKIRLHDRASVASSGNGGGSVRIRGDSLTIDNATVATINTGGADAKGGLDAQSRSLDIASGALISVATGSGQGAPISLQAGDVTLREGARVGSIAFGQGGAGPITVIADRLSIEGIGETFSTLIDSQAAFFANGLAGPITIAAGSVDIHKGGAILSRTYGASKAADISLNAGSLTMSGDSTAGVRSRIVSEGYPWATGDTGSVTLGITGPLLLSDTAQIGSRIEGSGNASPVTVDAGTITITGGAGDVFTGLISQVTETATGIGGMVSVRAGAIDLSGPYAQIASNTFGSSRAGDVTVEAGRLSITGVRGVFGDFRGVFVGIQANTSSGGRAGTVRVSTAGPLTITDGGEIGSNTFSAGHAGDVTVTAGSLSITGTGTSVLTGITSNADNGSTNDAGTVRVSTTGPLSITNGGEIGSNTFTTGNAGNVIVTAGSLSISGTHGKSFTGISSNANRLSSGNAGTVGVASAGALTIDQGGEIGSNGFSSGNAGDVTVWAGSMAITGDGGQSFTGISSNANRGSSPDVREGNAGTVTVGAGMLAISQGGSIASDTFGDGNAGAVTVHAGTLAIMGIPDEVFTGISSNAEPGSKGDAGTVRVTTTGDLAILNGGEIGSNTFGEGDAGAVTVKPGSLSIHGIDGPPRLTGIGSSAEQGSGGQGGIVHVTTAGRISLTHGGQIRSTTFEKGDAGSVTVQAGQLLIDRQGVPTATGVLSSAQPGSTGDGGSVTIRAGDLLLRRDGTVSAESEGTGTGGSVVITATDELALDGAAIRTQTTTANGGDITIQVGRLLDLHESAITTSVAGGTGSGGNIVIDPPFVVLDDSRIQANAQKGNGGNITIRADQLLSSPATVIEASSAESVSGTISTPAPDNTIASSLVKLPESFLGSRDLLRDTCAGRGGRASSSLIVGNGGGLPLDPAAPLPSPYGGPAGGKAGDASGPAPPLRFQMAARPGCR
ncbi:filamentous hemagglutinin N-terminal domain-containing protein [Azospirillum himalayense]|uniref:Filamentous hemagglutinin N-terminal domain-containing protein n=1 Tax=Azospirillum himalayense TaxID=654847 RepID=A0ABW0GDU9_9PROT